MLTKNPLKWGKTAHNMPLIKPKAISIEISNSCNLRCGICNQWKENNKIKKLKFKNFKKIIKEISKDFKDTFLEISGPEPLTNQKLLFRLLEYANSKNVRISLSTNGSLINKEIATKLLLYNLKHISISLDNHRSSVHDYIRNCKGTFCKTISSIKNLIKAKKTLNSKTEISITCTVTDYNARDLVNIYKLCKSLGVNCINYNAYVIDNTYLNKKPAYEKDRFWVKKEKISDLKKNIKLIINLAKKDEMPKITTPQVLLKEIPSYFQKKELFNTETTCKAGINYFHITSFGEITICGKGPYLNIKNYKLKEILKSKNFHKTLFKIKKCKIPCLNNCYYLK